MKTIEVSDEMYDDLMALSKEMLLQDNRSTAMPHIFQIQTTEEVAAYEGCGTTKWIGDEGEEVDEDAEDARSYQVTTEQRYQNTFFTAKACDEHIRLNHYHYKSPVCYLNHAWRNPEMDLVSKFLCELSGT